MPAFASSRGIMPLLLTNSSALAKRLLGVEMYSSSPFLITIGGGLSPSTFTYFGTGFGKLRPHQSQRVVGLVRSTCPDSSRQTRPTRSAHTYASFAGKETLSTTYFTCGHLVSISLLPSLISSLHFFTSIFYTVRITLSFLINGWGQAHCIQFNACRSSSIL